MERVICRAVFEFAISRDFATSGGRINYEIVSMLLPAIATPMTYEYGGKQFVVIAAGGNADFETDVGDAIVAFALKE